MPIEFWTWNTPNGRKISVALEEMGLAYDVHTVNISKDEQFAPAFLKISPNNKIPAIVDPEGPGGAPISVFESGAILLYLGEKTGKFLPTDPRRRVPVYEWLNWQMGGFGPMPGQVHHFLQVENEQDRRYGLERYSEPRSGSGFSPSLDWPPRTRTLGARSSQGAVRLDQEKVTDPDLRRSRPRTSTAGCSRWASAPGRRMRGAALDAAAS